MKNFKIKNILMCFLFIIIFLFNTVVCVYAEGEGVPGSSGTKPLSFVSCTLEDGSSINAEGGITTEPIFKIQFDKNIVNMLVWENNSKCFSLSTDNNSNVPVVVSKIDDTVDFDNRQIVYMHPSSSLQPGKTYYIKVAPNLIAKNGDSSLAGTTNGKGLTISFKTKGQVVQQAPTKNNNPSINTGSNKSAVSAAQPSQTTPQKNNTVQNSNQASNNNEATNSNATTNTAQSSGNKSTDNTNNASNTTTSAAAGQNSAQNNNSVNSANSTNAANTTNATNNSAVNSIGEANKKDSKAVVNNQEAAVQEKGVSLNTWIAIGTGIIVVLWIAIEIFVRRKKRERGNKPEV
jgi:hypothetical protein